MDESQTFDPDAFARLAKAEVGHFWFEERRALLAWAAGHYFPSATTFCEIGCGTGFVLDEFARRLPHLTLTGIDSYPQGLAFAASRLPKRVRLEQGSILDEPGPTRHDVVGCFDVLEHIPDDAAALRALACRLKPGGGLLITVPQHPALWSAADEIGHHQRRYTRGQLLQRLQAAGFTPLRMTSFISFLLPILCARRNQALTRDQALAELHPSPAANAVGIFLLRSERVLIRAGVSFPIGGSLLVVAERTNR